MPAAEWGAERLDLGAYLRRVGHAGDVTPTAATLRALHRAHLATVPFENLDIVLGHGIDVDLDAIIGKLVDRPRGGYCYEQNLLFAAALEQIGFGVERRLGRVGDADPPRARSHMVLEVEDGDGERWLADVGFGSGLLEPIPLEPGGPYEQGAWSFELTERDTGERELRERRGADWAVAYRFDEQRQHPADVVVANHFTSTYERSPFVGRAVAVRRDEEATHRLLDRTLSVTRPDGSVEERELDDREVADVLPRRFGIELAPEEEARLLATLP